MKSSSSDHTPSTWSFCSIQEDNSQSLGYNSNNDSESLTSRFSDEALAAITREKERWFEGRGRIAEKGIENLEGGCLGLEGRQRRKTPQTHLASLKGHSLADSPPPGLSLSLSRSLALNFPGLFMQGALRDRMERLVVLPFSVGCVSHSSVAVGRGHPKRTLTAGDPSPGRRKMAKGLRGFSRMFVLFKEKDEERKMEIGAPTGVKHIAHVGWDGGAASAPPGWDLGPELLSHSTVSVGQPGPAMAPPFLPGCLGRSG